MQSNVILGTLIVYKLLLLAIGLWASRRVADEGDFFIGSRNLGAWVAGLSYAASTSSAWVLLGFSGFVYVAGVSALWMVPGIWAGYVAVWLWFGPRLRREAAENRWVTPTEFLCGGIASDPARRRLAALATLLILVSFMFYIAAQFGAAATALTSNFAISHTSSVLIGATVILVYCLLGGFWAVSVTDMLQGIVMMLAAMIVPFVAVQAAGGYGNIFATLATTADNPLLDVTGGHAGMLFIGFVLGVMAPGAGALGQPHLLARLMAVRDERERRRGFAVAMTWAVVVYVGMASMALAARSLSITPADTEQLFFRLAADLLPPILAGVVIAAILSAVMSTVDSLLLAASAAVAHDLRIVRRFPGRDLLISRLVMTCLAIAAVILTLTLPDSIFNRVLFAWSALGAAFGPIATARVMKLEPGAGARGAAMAIGFTLTVMFYLYGAVDNAPASAPGRWLFTLAKLPGDPFERLFPWLPALLILFFGRRSSRAVAAGE